MKKGTKIRFCLSVTLLLAACGCIFWRGWVQFSVATDETGIMISKTGGVFSTPIGKGRFIWRWEPLLPTNARLLLFSSDSVHFQKRIQGSLPSADLYSLQIQQTPDFTYDFVFDIDLQVKPERLVELVSSGAVRTQEDISRFLEQGAERLVRLAASYLIDVSREQPAALLTAYSTEQILAGVFLSGDFSALDVRGVFVSAAKVPDVLLYNQAKQTFDGFQKQVDAELSALARKQAESIVSDNRAVNKLTKKGETLKKYPELSDVLKNSDTAAVLKALDTLQ